MPIVYSAKWGNFFLLRVQHMRCLKKMQGEGEADVATELISFFLKKTELMRVRPRQRIRERTRISVSSALMLLAHNISHQGRPLNSSAMSWRLEQWSLRRDGDDGLLSAQ